MSYNERLPTASVPYDSLTEFIALNVKCLTCHNVTLSVSLCSYDLPQLLRSLCMNTFLDENH